MHVGGGDAGWKNGTASSIINKIYFKKLTKEENKIESSESKVDYWHQNCSGPIYDSSVSMRDKKDYIFKSIAGGQGG